jgi:hypothetical protein
MATDVLLMWLTFGASIAAIAISAVTVVIVCATRRRIRHQLQEGSRGND